MTTFDPFGAQTLNTAAGYYNPVDCPLDPWGPPPDGWPSDWPWPPVQQV
jgi:hypothetical protein